MERQSAGVDGPWRIDSQCSAGPPVGTAIDQQVTDEVGAGVARRNEASSATKLFVGLPECSRHSVALQVDFRARIRVAPALP